MPDRSEPGRRLDPGWNVVCSPVDAMKTRIPTIQVIAAICCGQASLVLCAQTNEVDLASTPSYELQAASGIGLGLMVGEPTGLTVKGWLSEHS